MKKVVVLLLAMFVLATALVGCGGSTSSQSKPESKSHAQSQSKPESKPESKSETPIESESLVGGYTEERNLTAEDEKIFEEAMQGFVGVVYKPLKVATQVVAGTNYRFYCEATEVTSQPEGHHAYVTIFVPLGDGAVPELVDIEEVA